MGKYKQSKERTKLLKASESAVSKPTLVAGSRTLISGIKVLGQNFLKNPMIIQNIVDKAAIRPSDVVLEIGPGTGNLTVQLLDRAKKVIAIEYDKRMIRELLKRIEGSSSKDKLQIIQGDAVTVAFPFFNVLVANVPYSISSPLLFKLLIHRPMYRCAVIMFQEEFALRLTAKPGEEHYSRLSVNTSLLAKVDQLLKVAKNNFRPPPKVDSRVVRIELRNPPPAVNYTEWDGLIRLLFTRKHKLLHSVLCTKARLTMFRENLKTFHALNPDAAMDMDESKGIDGIKKIVESVLSRPEFKDKRASKMSQDDFIALLAAFNEKGIHFA